MGAEGTEGELMVWGYACKLFRDDEKALHIDSGKHLIPWMGDDKLTIDRYDGRGTLYDLISHEPVNGAWDSLSNEEKEVEMKCDNERYRAMYEEEEILIYQEEERKKLTNKYGQVAYSYDDNAVSTCEPPSQDIKFKAFTPPPNLEIPSELVKPETMKQHAIITKTAGFIAQQGSQMEVLMRLKQQGNQKFNFLTYGDPLHDYYKFLLNAIKSGSYIPSEADTSCLDDEESESDSYLHPSLLSSNSNTPPDPKNPPALIRLIISKMIRYITKNGLIFEEEIKKLNDQRFSFLDTSDIYYNYYREQVTSSFKIDGDILPEVKNDEKPVEKEEEKKATKRLKVTPVCFSLKKQKEADSLEATTALPQEDSTDDEESGSSPEHMPAPPPPPKISKKSKERSERNKSPDIIKKERKAKVAQFLKDLKYK